MLVIFIFVLIISLGYILSFLIIKELPLLERIGLSYLLGVGFTTFLAFIYSWVGIKITIISILVMLLIFIVIFRLACTLVKRKIAIKLPNVVNVYRNSKWYEKVILLAIVFLILLSFSITLYYPVNAWDALALYDFRAKIIAQTGYFVQVSNQFNYFSQYPLLTSLTHTIVYLSGGNNPQFIYSLYFLAFIIIFFSLIRKNSNRFISLLFTFLLLTSPTLFEHSTISYTNLPYTVYYVIGTIYLYFSVTQKRYDYLLISSLLFGLSTWVRSQEPFWLVGILVVLAYSIYKKSIFPLLVYLPGFLVIQRLWNLFQTHYINELFSTTGQFSFALKSLLGGVDFKRIMDISVYTYQNVILPWGYIAQLFVVAVIIDFISGYKKKNLIFLSIIAANFLVLYAGTYLFSLMFKGWREIPDSASRMSMFFPPLMIYYIALVLTGITSKREHVD